MVITKLKNQDKWQKIISIILLFMWMGLIFYFSNQKGSVSESNSNFVIDLLDSFFNIFSLDVNNIENIAFFVRKLAHIFLYFNLYLFTYYVLFQFNFKRRSLFSLVFCFFFAISDELHQVFIPNRSFGVIDILIDTIGSFISYLLIKFKDSSFMKIIKKIVLVVIILGLVLTLFFSLNKKILVNKKRNIEIEVSSLTLREKIGQMLVGYYYSDKVDKELIESLKKNQPGGFILVKSNFTTYDKSVKFIEDLNSYVDIPMFITIDNEGGSVQRLSSVSDTKTLYLPSMNRVGMINKEELAYGIGKIIGEESRSFGIGIVYAPVLDVGDYRNSAMGKRLISSNPDIVSNLGLEIAKGMIESGVTPVYKHFPGIGDTNIDTHSDLPIINKTKEELLENELKPFKYVIDNNMASMIMVGHASYPLITGDNTPSSLSKIIVTDILRDELGFEGVSMIDGVNMKALRNYYNEEEIYELGINAGIDMFIMPKGLERTIDIIENLVKDGKVKEETIDEAVVRILKLKKEKLLNFTSLNKEYINRKESIDLLKKYNLYVD